MRRSKIIRRRRRRRIKRASQARKMNLIGKKTYPMILTLPSSKACATAVEKKVTEAQNALKKINPRRIGQLTEPEKLRLYKQQWQEEEMFSQLYLLHLQSTSRKDLHSVGWHAASVSIKYKMK
jgi:hypothetical protein